MGKEGQRQRRGAVACGHPATAAAADEILAEGGNAFDAVLAAFCAACAAEPVLASLGGGGFLLAQPANREPLLYDFFVQTPKQRPDPAALDFYPILADFGTATQEFQIGVGAVAVPGAVGGLFAIHDDLASLPMTRIVEPAARLAREGVELRPIDGYLFDVVSPILKATPEARGLFLNDEGRLLAPGERLRQPRLADSLEALAGEGARLFYEGDFARRLVRLCRESGGLLDEADLAEYRVERRKPFVCDYRGHRVTTNPPPSCGGILIAFALALLSKAEPARLGAGTLEGLDLLARVMSQTNKARIEAHLAEGAEIAAGRLFEPALLKRYQDEVGGHPGFSRGTTHISVVDGDGNLAAMSLSNGEGCGTLLPGCGIMLNNMLGEEDLNHGGFHRWPEDCRLSSMMAPSLATSDEGALYAIGSGGSNRIRTAVLQVLVNLLDHRMDMAAATEAPRLHVEGESANLEGGLPEAAAAALSGQGYRTIAWPRHNLFFGGVHGVALSADGALSAAGDPRRGGAALVRAA
ncbi:gamma-glutamyltransferase [Pelagibius sp. CAU 1746]|uniref:gamma-glutamyltransferase n=1 Tax=Pelagibius sp. CAU 1746 TaxID=3140370 RepID=UPI00325B0030